MSGFHLWLHMEAGTGGQRCQMWEQGWLWPLAWGLWPEPVPEQAVWGSSDLRTKPSQGETPCTHAEFVGPSQACPPLH